MSIFFCPNLNFGYFVQIATQYFVNYHYMPKNMPTFL